MAASIKINLGAGASPNTGALDLSDDRRPTLIKPAAIEIAQAWLAAGKIPLEVFAAIIAEPGYDMRDIYRYGALIDEEVWKLLAPNSTYLWLSASRTTTSTQTGTTTPVRYELKFNTADSSSHSIGLRSFSDNGTFIIYGHIKGDGATNSFGAAFSVLVRVRGGTAQVGPLIVSQLEGSGTPIPAFAGTLDVAASGNVVSLTLAASTTEDTAWTTNFEVV